MKKASGQLGLGCPPGSPIARVPRLLPGRAHRSYATGNTHQALLVVRNKFVVNKSYEVNQVYFNFISSILIYDSKYIFGIYIYLVYRVAQKKVYAFDFVQRKNYKCYVPQINVILSRKA